MNNRSKLGNNKKLQNTVGLKGNNTWPFCIISGLPFSLLFLLDTEAWGLTLPKKRSRVPQPFLCHFWWTCWPLSAAELYLSCTSTCQHICRNSYVIISCYFEFQLSFCLPNCTSVHWSSTSIFVFGSLSPFALLQCSFSHFSSFGSLVPFQLISFYVCSFSCLGG